MQATQPAWILSFPVLLFLLLMAAIVLKAVNHRRGAALVVAACSLFVGVCLLYALTGRSRAVTYVAELPLPPPVPVQLVIPANPVAFAGQVTDTTIPLEPAQPKAAVPPLPAWVGQTEKTVDGVTTFSVTAGPHATDELCKRELTPVLRKEVDEYIDGYIGVPGAGRRVDLEMNYIRDHLIQDQHFETVGASFGPMRNLHALVRIDGSTNDLIRRQHNDALVQARLGYAGGAFGLLLVLLGTAYGYLKLDTATKGYYSGRLKLAATAVILTAAAATALVVRQADPAAEWPVAFPAREASQF